MATYVVSVHRTAKSKRQRNSHGLPVHIEGASVDIAVATTRDRIFPFLHDPTSKVMNRVGSTVMKTERMNELGGTTLYISLTNFLFSLSLACLLDLSGLCVD